MLNRNITGVSPFAPAPEQSWTQAQQKILRALQQEENRQLPLRTLWRHVGINKHIWYEAIKDRRFVAAVEALGVPVKRQGKRHVQVDLVLHPEEELAKDVWDIRCLKSDYPKHRAPGDFKVDFTWIENPLLRHQVKDYFRHHLTRWKPKTFSCNLACLRRFLTFLPPEIHVGILSRKLVEEILPKLGCQWSDYAVRRGLQATRAMLAYMTTSPAWTGPRPARFLIWDEDIPSRPSTLPRPIPPAVLDQLDMWLEKAVEAIKQGQTPPLLAPMHWEAILILRHTGMRAEDVAHLKAPDEHGRNGCLDQDAEGYWWIRLHHSVSKMDKDHRIPTRMSDGVLDAVRRQQARSQEIPDHFGEHYLFRYERGILSYNALLQALRKLAPHLAYEDHPYSIAPHQFRHSIATDMIEMGVDVYTVKEFLGHKSLAMTERYIKVYLSSLKAKYDAYRVKKQQTYATEMMATQIHITQPEGDAGGGWVENKVGKLYVSPLPDGIGNCVHLPMHDGCPDAPHCPTCPKLRASKRHLPVWENKAKNLLITVEALRSNPAYARARQKHEQELCHAEKVITIIKEEGFWDGRIHNG